MDDSLDRLYENLILDPTYIHASLAPEYSRGKVWHRWWGHGTGIDDIAYYNSKKELHRIYGPAYIGRAYKYELWYKDGLLHRIGGPAMILKNEEFWFKDGTPHRIGGPAVLGQGRPKEYWIGGQKLSPKQYNIEMKRRKHRGLET